MRSSVSYRAPKADLRLVSEVEVAVDAVLVCPSQAPPVPTENLRRGAEHRLGNCCHHSMVEPSRLSFDLFLDSRFHFVSSRRDFGVRQLYRC